jgi:hypothetical protein
MGGKIHRIVRGSIISKNCTINRCLLRSLGLVGSSVLNQSVGFMKFVR